MCVCGYLTTAEASVCAPGALFSSFQRAVKFMQMDNDVTECSVLIGCAKMLNANNTDDLTI